MPQLEVAHYRSCAVAKPAEELKTVLTGVTVEDGEIDRLRDEVIAAFDGPVDESPVVVLELLVASRILRVYNREVEDAVIRHTGRIPEFLTSWIIPESTALDGAIVRSVGAWKVSR
ncbi:MAG: hypothetical protein AAB383_02990 [Patescibacteria group bacterium]